jgi:hypothetical protein
MKPAPVQDAPATVAAAATFSSIDQIPDAAPEVPRQPRRRPRAGEGNVASEPLVFIETAAEKLQQVALSDEEAPRRSTPRPRKSRTAASEPLVFVETVNKPGDQTSA